MIARTIPMTRSQRSQYLGRRGMLVAAWRSREPEGRPGPQVPDPDAERVVLPRRRAVADRRRAPERDGCPSWVVTVRARRAVPRAACRGPEADRGPSAAAGGLPAVEGGLSAAGRVGSVRRCVLFVRLDDVERALPAGLRPLPPLRALTGWPPAERRVVFERLEWPECPPVVGRAFPAGLRPLEEPSSAGRGAPETRGVEAERRGWLEPAPEDEPAPPVRRRLLRCGLPPLFRPFAMRTTVPAPPAPHRGGARG